MEDGLTPASGTASVSTSKSAATGRARFTTKSIASVSVIRISSSSRNASQASAKRAGVRLKPLGRSCRFQVQKRARVSLEFLGVAENPLSGLLNRAEVLCEIISPPVKRFPTSTRQYRYPLEVSMGYTETFDGRSAIGFFPDPTVGQPRTLEQQWKK